MVAEDFVFISKLWAATQYLKSFDSINKKIITSNGLENLKSQFEKLLYDDSRPIEEKFDYFMDNIKGIGISILTEILWLYDPSKYPLINHKAIEALKTLEVDILILDKHKIKGKDYIEYSKILKIIMEYVNGQGLNEINDYISLDYLLFIIFENPDIALGAPVKPNVKTNSNILLKSKKQIILYGPPGTGKTYKAREYATEFLSGHAENILSDNSLEQNVWIIEINPKGRFFDVIGAINDEELKEDVWPSDRYKGIKKGDIGLMCTLGENAGIYAQINILSNPGMMFEPEASMKHWKSPDHKNTKIMRVKYNYKNKFTDNPILISDLLKIKGLENLEILTSPQNTNFKVNKEEWEIISKLIEERKT